MLIMAVFGPKRGDELSHAPQVVSRLAQLRRSQRCSMCTIVPTLSVVKNSYMHGKCGLACSFRL